MLVEGVHARRIGWGGAKTDEAIRPNQNSSAIGDAGLCRVKSRRSSIIDGHQPTPTRAKIVEARRLPEDEEMVTRPAQANPAGETLAGRRRSRRRSRLTDERASRIGHIEHAAPPRCRERLDGIGRR